MNKKLISTMILSAVLITACNDDSKKNAEASANVVEEQKNVAAVEENTQAETANDSNAAPESDNAASDSEHVDEKVDANADLAEPSAAQETTAPESEVEAEAEGDVVNPNEVVAEDDKEQTLEEPKSEEANSEDPKPEEPKNEQAVIPLRYLEGRDYLPLAAQIEQVEEPKIIEFFWYGCPHCYDMHEPMNTWVQNDKPESIEFETVPAMPSARWEIGGHLYYAGKSLGLDIDDAVFEEVHQKGNSGIILDEDKAKSFLVSQGVDKEQVEKAWDSFGVKQEISRAKKLFDDSGLNGVPAFIVNGTYEVPFQGEYETFFPKLEALVQSQQTR